MPAIPAGLTAQRANIFLFESAIVRLAAIHRVIHTAVR